MRIHKVINQPIDEEHGGVRVAGGINAVISAAVNEAASSITRVTSRQTIVQRNGRTEVFEQHSETNQGGNR